jgi:hypothetical protein
VPDGASKCPIDRGDVTKSSDAYELSTVVETALARATPLGACRKTRTPPVILLGPTNPGRSRQRRRWDQKGCGVACYLEGRARSSTV